MKKSYILAKTGIKLAGEYPAVGEALPDHIVKQIAPNLLVALLNTGTLIEEREDGIAPADQFATLQATVDGLTKTVVDQGEQITELLDLVRGLKTTGGKK